MAEEQILKIDEVALAAWRTRARELAQWVWGRMVNRPDAFGHYLPLAARKPKQTAITDKSGLTLAVLQKHFECRDRGDVIGLHSTVRDEVTGEGEVPACWSKWLGIDIDRHDEQADPESTREAAFFWFNRLRHLGFNPLLFDSDGRGGFHLIVIFDAPVATERVFRFGKWLVRDWESFGLSDEPETFPKQATLGRGKGFGNWLRLPPLHHTREHLSRLWDGEAWLDGERAIAAILATEGSSAECMPASAIEAFESHSKGGKARDDGPTEFELVRSALDSLRHMASNYDDWIKIGMSLRSLGDEGLAIWDRWSENDLSKYQAGACAAKWSSFSAANGSGSGVGIGTIFFLAGKAGWQRPAAPSLRAYRNGTAEPVEPIKPVGGDRPRRFNLTDLGNAERLIARHGNDLRFCHPWAKWLCWDGTRWALDETGEASRRAQETMRSIYAEASDEPDDDRRKAIIRHAHDSEKRDRISAALSLAQSQIGVPVLPHQLDLDPWCFNCPNGTVDLRSSELMPHRREDLITKLCPVEFQVLARCPLWDGTLDLFFAGNGTLIRYFQRIAGYALTGVIREHILPIAYGKGSNGKSTILGALLDTFGSEYAIKAAPDMLMAKRGADHPTDRADLFGRRLVVAIETEDGRRLNEVMIKELTGGDRIRARRMREDFWEFTPTHKLMMATNHKPVVRGTDIGIWRRLKLLPFHVRVEGDSDDSGMPAKLAAERSGILAWCIRGCLDWQTSGLGTPPEVEDATSAYRAEQDLIGRFLDECTTMVAEAKCKASELYARYSGWCADGNEHPVTQTAFGKSMVERDYERKTSNGTWYHGIGLVPR